MQHRLVWVYTCQNATLLEITCHGSFVCLQDDQAGKIQVMGIDNLETLKGKVSVIWPQGYETIFMLNSTEHEIDHAHKC